MPLEMTAENPAESRWRSIINLFSPRGDFAGRTFRLRFGPFALSQSVTGIIPITLFALHGPEHLRFYALLFLAFKISLGAVLTAAIVSRFFPVTVGETGIRARNFWGMARVITWHEMASVAPIRWLFFTSFARISTHRAKNWVWLPLFLRQQNEFEAQVRKFAPVDNPLREFFEK